MKPFPFELLGWHWKLLV